MIILNSNGYLKFIYIYINEYFRYKKPIIKEKFKYIILIRDPINRFISAFNWKMFRCTTKEGKNFEGLKIENNINEIEGYKYWNDINN